MFLFSSEKLEKDKHLKLVVSHVSTDVTYTLNHYYLFTQRKYTNTLTLFHMIGGVKINVHAKKSLRPNLQYYINQYVLISITQLVFKFLSVQRKMAEFLLCQISLRTIILVGQQIVTVCNER